MKPISRFLIFLMEIAEPLEVAYLGGSHIAWVRFIGECNHRMGHMVMKMGGNPEEALMGCRTEQVKEWIAKWKP